MVCAHLDILTEADEAAGPLRLDHPARRVSAIHVQSLLVELGYATPAIAIREAVMAPLEPAVVGFLLHREGMTLEQMATTSRSSRARSTRDRGWVSSPARSPGRTPPSSTRRADDHVGSESASHRERPGVTDT